MQAKDILEKEIMSVSLVWLFYYRAKIISTQHGILNTNIPITYNMKQNGS